MSAELAARRTAAAAVLADYQHQAPAADASERAMWGARLADMLALVLAIDAEPEPGKLAAIRQVLADFDWERDDRQYALERIDQIAGASRAASGPELGGGAYISPADLPVLGHALADATTYRDPAGVCPDCDKHPAALCADHAEDLNRTDAYLALARELGIEVDR
jgi:hypothetical protein